MLVSGFIFAYLLVEALKRKIPSYEWFEVSFSNFGWSNHTEILKNSKNKERVKLTLEIIEKFITAKGIKTL